MYRNKRLFAAGIIIVFAILLTISIQRGRNSRVFLPQTRTVTVESPEQAAVTWLESGVRGRTLLLFDSYPHMGGLRFYDASPQLTRWNFVEYSILKNIIRSILLVVPDEEWPDFIRRVEVRPLSGTHSEERKMQLTTTSGIPMTAITPQSMPDLPEKVLVYINRGRFDYELALSLLAHKGIQSDLVIEYRDTGK